MVRSEGLTGVVLTALVGASDVVRSGVFMSCVLIKIMLGARPARNQCIHTDGELKPLVPSYDESLVNAPVRTGRSPWKLR
ncbi:hypothetical protein GCM10010372_07150 [Streptomyces tauricus]|nr:hypothetical protein GCM10010372_07150 [Streptomyces tauricus]